MTDFSKQKVATAVDNRSKLDVSSTHITTQSFMQSQPVYYRHMLPGETIQGQGNVLTRLAPVAVPSYGRCRVNMRAFFVPFRTIMPHWNDFIGDTIATSYTDASLVSKSPVISNDAFIVTIINGSYFGQNLCDELTTWSVGDPYDFYFNTKHYAYTYWGRLYKKIWESLGYKIIWENKDDLLWSALPLLAYLRIYADWYSSQAYASTATYLAAMKLFSFNNPTTNLQISSSDLNVIMPFIAVCCYDNGNDVYTNAWDKPIAPNDSIYSTFQASDITAATNAAYVTFDSSGTPYMTQQLASSTGIGTTYIHQMLRAVTDYVKRNQLAGARAVDRYLARFGINLDSAKVNRSIYVASQSVDVDFGSVMQTVNTASVGQDSNLGDYAGQGLGRGQLGFDFHTDEYGMFIVVASVIPAASIYQGFDRNNLHIDKTDFWTPEFDSLGVQVVDKGEVYVSRNSGFANTPEDYKGVFGYAPRYYEYKQGRDFVTGDFVSEFAINGGDAWHLCREFDDASFGGFISGLNHSVNFVRGTDAKTYDRIFNYTGGDYDCFYNVYHFAVQSTAPCKSLFDTYDFEEAGKQITMSSNSPLAVILIS